MITLVIAALIGSQTIVVPTTPVAPSQALPATASSPQIKAPDPATPPSSVPAPAIQAAPKPVIAPSSATKPTPSSRASSASASLNTVDRTALPTAQTLPPQPSGLPAGVTGGPVFGGAPAIQTSGH